MLESETRELMERAWGKRFDITYKNKTPTLGALIGGCPNCGHLCDFNEETF